MELYANLRIIRKNWWLVVLTMLIAACSAAVIDHVTHARTVYVSTATLVLNPNVPHRLLFNSGSPAQLSQGSRIDLATLAATYDNYFADSANAQAVIQSTTPRLSMTPDQLVARTSTQLIPGTLVYQISVTGYDRQQTYWAALGWADKFVGDDVQAAGAQARIAVQLTNPNANLPLEQATQQYWGQQIGQLEQQLLAVLSDKTLSAAQKRRRVVALQNQVAALEADEARGAALTQPPTQQGATTTPPATFPQPMAYASYNEGITASTVLARSLLFRNIVLFAALGGMIVGLALALLREYLDLSLRNAEEVAETFSVPVLATIGLFRARLASRPARGRTQRAGLGEQAPSVSHDAKGALIALSNPFDVASEAFRSLRTGILFAGATRKVRTIVVTSAAPGEGKSVVAANLAVVMAQAGARIIVVDADLRRPVQHTLFGLSGTSGLSTLYLVDEAEVRASMRAALQPTPIPNLRVLNAGQIAPNPAELLAAARTGAIVDALKEQADLVIFDTPAMGILTDAVILAAHADGTLLVVRARATRRDLVKSALAKLSGVNARVLGVVLNMADVPGGAYADYYRTRWWARRGGIFAPRATASLRSQSPPR